MAMRPHTVLGALVAMAALISHAFAAGDFRPGGLTLNEARARLGTSVGAVPGCLPAGHRYGMADQAVGGGVVARTLAVLRQSATAAALLDLAQARRVHICLDGATHLLAYYFAGARVIGLSARLTDAGKVLFLAHELGHVPQHPTYSDNRYFPPKDLILLRRVREAAAEALATRIAWELRGAGHPDVWREKVLTHYGDVAHAFQEVVLAEVPTGALPPRQRLDRATRAAFDRWFAAAWRRRVYDRMTVDHLERISGDAMGLVPARRSASHAFLLGTGRIGRSNFLAETDGPPLDDRVYAGAVAPEVEQRLGRLLDRARVSEAPARDAAQAGLGS